MVTALKERHRVLRKGSEISNKDGAWTSSLVLWAELMCELEISRFHRHLELTTLKERRIRGDIIETFKIMTGKERVDRSRLFQLSTCEYQLRGHTMKLSKQRTSLDVRKFSFSQRVVQEWNKLSQDVVEATSVNQFKNRLDKFWQRYGH